MVLLVLLVFRRFFGGNVVMWILWKIEKIKNKRIKVYNVKCGCYIVVRMYVVLTYRLTVDWGAGVMALWSIWNQSESTSSLKREDSAGSLFQECAAFSKRQVHGYNVTLSWMKPSLNRYRRYVYVQWPWALIARGLMAFTFHLRIWDVETFTTLQLSHRKTVDTGNTAPNTGTGQRGSGKSGKPAETAETCTFFVLIFVTVKWDSVGYFLTIWTSLKNRDRLTG